MPFKCCFDIYWSVNMMTNEDWVQDFASVTDAEEWAAKYADELVITSDGRLTHKDIVWWVEEYHNG